MPSGSSSSTMISYEEIMGIQNASTAYSVTNGNGSSGPDNTTGESSLSFSNKNAIKSLSKRLITFRKWLVDDAKVTIHPAVCMVNGEATDGTKNAPVLVVEKSSVKNPVVANGLNGNISAGTGNGTDLLTSATSSTVSIIDNIATSGRIGTIDGDCDITLYDRTMGCCVRVTRELKTNEVVMSIPRSAMITPDLVAASDAGRAILSCCKINKAAMDRLTSNNGSNNNINGNGNSVNNHGPNTLGFWDAFENTTICESKFSTKIVRTNGPQVLVKILQERKRAEAACKKATAKKLVETTTGESEDSEVQYQLAEYGTISSRAPFLAFLIHQRFSNSLRPKVVTYDTTTSMYNEELDDDDNDNDENEFQMARDSDDGNALSAIDTHGGSMITLPPRAATTFAPYARTLPSSVSIPLCWKRSELALLANCIPGVPVLQEVATTTSQLVSEFTALLDAGVTTRFPKTFPEGLLTWDRWVWAAAVFTSRLLPASCYLNAGDDKATNFRPTNIAEFQSPAHIWDELGVLVPLLDMLNHEIDEHQITWQPCSATASTSDDPGDGNRLEEVTENLSTTSGRAIVHKKVKKGSELYTCYGHISTSNLILQYGFAQLNGSFDEVRMGWALADAVGNVSPPTDYVPIFEIDNDFVFESSDEISINSWWTDDRITLLERNAFAATDSTFMSNLRAGMKMTVTAHSDGTFHPILLAATVFATMPEPYVKKFVSGNDITSKIVVSKRHQLIIQRYLQFSFTRKLEKLLQNLDNGLKDHYGVINLWTKASEGGLRYSSTMSSEDSNNKVGWQSFFDTHAYKATMEVEKHYYAMGSDSCVLALYDGQLRALQTSFDTVSDNEKFATNVVQQLHDLGFEPIDGEIDVPDEKMNDISNTKVVKTENLMVDDNRKLPDGISAVDAEAKVTEKNVPPRKENASSNGNKSPRNRKRNRKRVPIANATNSSTSGNKPLAVKLHIGNLSYSTTPSQLYDYFASVYSEDNILECTIPIERDSGKSRGFGFVSLPEAIAMRALQGNDKHELDGRVLKIAKSISVGAETKIPEAPPASASDRCSICGYRPKYCTCPAPNLPVYQRFDGLHRGVPMPPLHPLMHGPPPPHLRPPPPPGRPYGPPMDYGIELPRGDYRGYYDMAPDRYMNGSRRDYYEHGNRPRDYDRDRRYDYGYDDDYYHGRYERDSDLHRDGNSRERDRNRDKSHERRSSSRTRVSKQEYDSTRGSRDRDESHQSSRRPGGRKGDDERGDQAGRKRNLDRKDRNKKKKSKRRTKSRSRSKSPA